LKNFKKLRVGEMPDVGKRYSDENTRRQHPSHRLQKSTEMGVGEKRTS